LFGRRRRTVFLQALGPTVTVRPRRIELRCKGPQRLQNGVVRVERCAIAVDADEAARLDRVPLATTRAAPRRFVTQRNRASEPQEADPLSLPVRLGADPYEAALGPHTTA